MGEAVDRYKLERVSVAIVDDHEVVLEGFRSYMQRNGVGNVEAFQTAQALLNRMQFGLFDVYIVDVELTDMNVDTLVKCIRQQHAGARIVVNTMHEEMWVARRMEELQVDGVIYKSVNLELLLEAIVTVMAGRTYFCQKYKRTQAHLHLHNDLLSQREQDVMRGIANGLSSKEIAKQLYISPSTVETHRQNLFSKLGARNMGEMVAKAIGAGYLKPSDINSKTL